MSALDLEDLKQRIIEALTAMEPETDMCYKAAAADTFHECLRLAQERGRRVRIVNGPTGIDIEFLR